MRNVVVSYKASEGLDAFHTETRNELIHSKEQIMRKLIAVTAIAVGMLMANNAAFAGSNEHGKRPAASCAIKKQAPTRAAYMKKLRHSPYLSANNRCVRVDGRVTQRERNCLAASHYRAQRPSRYDDHPRVSHYNGRVTHVSYAR